MTLPAPEERLTNHTPGPWQSQGWVPTWAYIPVHDASHNLVASLYPNEGRGYTRGQVEANAALIAQAPALLERVKELEGALRLAEEWLSGWASAEPYLSKIRAVLPALAEKDAR